MITSKIKCKDKTYQIQTPDSFSQTQKWNLDQSQKQFQLRQMSQFYPQSHSQFIHKQFLYVPQPSQNSILDSNHQQIDKFIFNQKTPKKQNKNTPRFLARLAIRYLKEYKKDHYNSQLNQKIIEQCLKLQNWHKKNKRNVYLIKHLELFFASQKIFTNQQLKINRNTFRKILGNQAQKELHDSGSQVTKNKKQYLRACKIYSLRCMSKKLVVRNQTK